MSPGLTTRGLTTRGLTTRGLTTRGLTTRGLLAVWLVAAAVALPPAAARADVSVGIDNPNPRGVVDHFEVYDLVCKQSLSMLVLAGRTSATITVCGGLDQPGDLRIRYDGELNWTEYPELHSWSVIELPERPRDKRPRPTVRDLDND